MARETLASLCTRNTELEQQLAEARAEIASLHIKQRPSRSVDVPIITIGGRRCYKLTGWVNGSRVTTYRPVA